MKSVDYSDWLSFAATRTLYHDDRTNVKTFAFLHEIVKTHSITTWQCSQPCVKW